MTIKSFFQNPAAGHVVMCAMIVLGIVILCIGSLWANR